jgi:hypothetical protein
LALDELAQYRSIDANTRKYVDSNADVFDAYRINLQEINEVVDKSI